MKYCTDTGFILALFNEDQKATNILEDVRYGKAQLIIPLIAYGESIRKLLHQGVHLENIEAFYRKIEQAEKVQMLELTRQIANEGAQISLRYGLPLMDAFVAASGKISGCDRLLARDSDFKVMIKKNYLKVQSW